MKRWIDGCVPVLPQPFYDLARLSVIEKLARLCCLGICPFIMQLQNRKTNSGNRPPNVINFVGAGGEGGRGVEGEVGWRGGTIIAGGRILISCRFLPVWLAWPWPITSELCVTVSLPVLPKEWTEAGQDGGRREERERERETKQDTWRWDGRKVNRVEEVEEKSKKRGGRRGNLYPDLRCTDMKAHTSFIHLI